MTTTDGTFEFDPYERYTREQINSVGLMPTENIEEVKYEEPYPVGDAQPCDDCRGQGRLVEKRGNFRGGEEYYRVSKCRQCDGSGEIKFLCEHCGARGEFTTSKGMKVKHASGCPDQEFCMEQINDGYTICGRPVVATFDVYADGRKHGYCGIHAKNKEYREKAAHARKEQMAEHAWKYAEQEKKAETEDEILKVLEAQFGVTDLKIISHYGEPKQVLLPFEALKKFFNLTEPEHVDPLETLPIEITNDPAPF